MEKVPESVNIESTKLKFLRKKLGLSQREMAKEFYVSPGAIALWENGNRPVPGPVKKLIEIYENLIDTKVKDTDNEER